MEYLEMEMEIPVLDIMFAKAKYVGQSEVVIIQKRAECSRIMVLILLHAAAKLLQSCPTLCDPIDSSPSGSPVPGILQVRTLEWGAIAFSDTSP